MPTDKETKRQPFKDMINPAVIADLAGRLAAVQPDFAAQDFVGQACSGLAELELKDRIQHVATALRAHLDDDFPTAAAHILAALPPPVHSTEQISAGGFGLWVLCQYVQDNGLEHFDAAFKTMKALTCHFSCEFAVRPFLVRYPDRALATLHCWTSDPNPHVRRLVSEGSRPRLPWGEQLRAFVADPEPTLALLHQLKDDPDLYVRRSVANHLNDIGKDHPERLVEICAAWSQEASAERVWIVRHALRSLVKAGHAGALAVLGVGPAVVRDVELVVTPGVVNIGQKVRLKLHLRSDSQSEQRLVVDYAVHFQKVRGTSPKVFKWRTGSLAAGEQLRLEKTHSFRDVSVRKHRPGPHRIVLLVNGKALAETTVEVI